MGRLMKWLDLAGMAIAVICILVMMLITSYDALSRYLLNGPLIWSFEIINYYLLGFTLFFAVAPTFATGSHISIDLFRRMFPVRLRNWIDVVWCLLAAAAFALIAYAAWGELHKAVDRRLFYPGLVRWPAWIAYLPIMTGSAPGMAPTATAFGVIRFSGVYRNA